MRKFVFGLTALAFAAGSLLGTSTASALTAVQLINAGAGGSLKAEDKSREFLEKTGDVNDPSYNSDPNIIDIGDRLTGVFQIEGLEYEGGGTASLVAGSGNEFIVGVFSTELVVKNDFGSFFQFEFAAPGGGDGVFASVYSLSPGTVFDITTQGYVDLYNTFTSGTKLFDLSFVAANGNFWTAFANTDDTSQISLSNSVNFNFEVTITDILASLNLASDIAQGSGKVDNNLTANSGEFPLANDIDFNLQIGVGEVIPEPATAGLMGLGLLAALGMRRRRTA
jgi:hypothetical protein